MLRQVCWGDCAVQAVEKSIRYVLIRGGLVLVMNESNSVVLAADVLALQKGLEVKTLSAVFLLVKLLKGVI